MRGAVKPYVTPRSSNSSVFADTRTRSSGNTRAKNVRADPVSSLNQRRRDPVFRSLAVLTRLDDGPDVLVGERHDLPGCPERVVGKPIGKRRDRLVRGPLRRIERVSLKRTNLTEIRVLCLHPRRGRDAHAGDVAADRSEIWKRWLVAFPGDLRPAVNAAAERPGEIDQIVANPRDAIGGREDVLRADGTGVGVVDPRFEYGQPAQIAPVFVGNGVIRIVAPHAPDLKWSEQ